MRVAAPDSAALGQWREGSVLAATPRGVLLSNGWFNGDTVPLPLDGSIRLQVRRKNATSLVLGTVGGLALGVSAGGLAPQNTLGSWWGEKTPGHRAEMVYFGLAGALVGWTASWLLASPRWQEIPLGPTGIPGAVAPLTRLPARPAAPGRLERWQVFPTTQADFAAFFWAHRDSLDAIEGLWERLPAGRYDELYAIVRDRRYQGWEFVAVWLPGRGTVGLSFDRPHGRIVWALRHRPEGGTYDLMETGVRDVARQGQQHVVLRDDLMQVWPHLTEWGRVPFAPQR